jgi:hypothetical protein
MMIKLALRFVLIVAAYLAFAGQVSIDECVAAVASASAVTLLSLFAHRLHPTQFHFSPAVVACQVLAALPKLLTDSLAVIPRLVRGGWRAGTMSQEFVVRDGRDRDTAWWAVFTLATSLPPNSYVISRLARPGEVVMHRLAEQRRR